jgi:hypothetical protein
LGSTKISENEVVRLWQKRVQTQRHWLDSEGNPVEVFYPGRLNDSLGGDFRDAFIRTFQGNKQGFIEIHTHTSKWESHGHHLDSKYNQVILHVVWEMDRPGRTVLQNGHTVPTITIQPVNSPGKSKKLIQPALPCKASGRRLDFQSIKTILSSAGDLRFGEAAEKRHVQDSDVESGQELFNGIMEALGYSKNKKAFRALSSSLTLNNLEEIVRNSLSVEEGLVTLQALLLGKAGLLPSQRKLALPSDDYLGRVEASWVARKQPSFLTAQDWELFKVRPGNYPTRRIAALTHLLFNWGKKGCLESLLDLVRGAPSKNAHSCLESAFLVPSQGYWADHFDFDSNISEQNVFLLGKSRAAEIIINILLPFSYKWALQHSDTALRNKALQIYKEYPRLESNSVERHMRNQLELELNHLKSARHQQGLLHIYKHLCTQGKCPNCGFSN